jgi:hypothetical protein
MSFFNVLQRPIIFAQMWDEDIPSFIQALTTLDDGSFISSSSANSTVKSGSQTPDNNKVQDCSAEAYEGVSSPGTNSGQSSVDT